MSIFHPEEVPYCSELSTDETIFNSDGLRISEKLAKGFVNMCRKNNHRFSSLEEMRKFGLVEETNRMQFEIYLPDKEDFSYEIIRYHQNKK